MINGSRDGQYCLRAGMGSFLKEQKSNGTVGFKEYQQGSGGVGKLDIALNCSPYIPFQT